MIGIPCYAAIRPNSRTLSVHQGKGGTETAAKLSAIMEAVEFAIAERPQTSRKVTSISDISKSASAYYWPERQLPRSFSCQKDAPIDWLKGYRLSSSAPVYVPLDSVAIAPNAAEKLPFAQSSNGLAAGFSEPEAIIHALCELIERDASTLWALRSLDHCARTAIDLDQIDDVQVEATLGKLRKAKIQVLAFDLTTDLGLPSVMAIIWSGTPSLYFDVASGVCAHPSPIRALLGAMEEAAQTRISNIAGARDDIEPAEYLQPLPGWLPELMTKSKPARSLPPALSEDALAELPTRLDDGLIVVPLSAPDDAISVVKVLSSKLEDRSTNVHWRPGPRAIKAMTAL